jgi:hypothetical protein
MAAVLKNKETSHHQTGSKIMMGGNNTMKKHGNGIRVIAFVLFFCMVTIMTANPATWYVRTTGNDANLGDSPAQALATISRVLFKNPADGDIIDVGPGTYTPAAVENFTVARSLTLRGSDPNDRPIYQNIEIVLLDVDSFTIQDMVLDGMHSVQDILTIKTGSTNVTVQGSDLIRPSYVAPGVMHGNIIVEDCQGLSLLNSTISADHNSALAPSLTQNLAFMPGFTASSNVNITGCTFSLEPTPGGSSGGNIRIEQGLTNFTLENSTFAMAPREWIYISGADSLAPINYFINMTIRNNTFVETTRVTGIYFSNPNFFENFIFEGNDVSDTQDAALWFAGSVDSTNLDRMGSTIDGLSISNNNFHNIAVGTSLLTDAVIIMDQCYLNPTNGRSTKINNNRITDDRGGSQGGWSIIIRSSGVGPIITDNVVQDRREVPIIVDSAFTHAMLPVSSLDGMIITGNTCIFSNWAGITLQDLPKNGVIIENNIVQDCVQYGISLESQENLNVSIRFNDVWRCGAGIQTSAPGTVISSNEVFNSLRTDRGGIFLSVFGTSDVSNSIVSNNLTTGCAGYGIKAATEVTGFGLNVYNNTIANNANSGVLIGRDNMNFYNNIVAFHEGPASVGIEYAAITMGQIGYNLVFTLFGTEYGGFAIPNPVFPGDVHSNPKFNSMFTNDFTLKSDSPALRAGAVLQGTTFIPNSSDLGAYPSAGSAGSAVTASAWELYR